MVHAFNKLNAATIPASTPIPRKDVLQNNMAGCTVFSALDMVDGYYQLLMRVSDIPLTAVSTPSGMLLEWLVMPQGLSNATATFNRLVTQLFRPMRHFVQTHFDNIFVHNRASEGKTAVEAHIGHLREVRLCMRENHLYANINKCNFGADQIPFLGCFLGKDGVRADPEKVCAIAQWPVPISQKDLRKWLGLANDLHKYSANYAEMVRPLTNLFKKDDVWSWTSEAQQAFEAIKASLLSADEDRPFSVVCDASDFAIGCALLQVDAEGRERVVSFQSRQLKAAEKNYPVDDKELVAMKYALVKFRVHLLDYELAHLTYLESPLYELIREAYAGDGDLAGLVEALSVPNKTVGLTARQRSRLHRYSVVASLLYHQVDGGDEPRIVVPNDEDLRHRVLYEAHDTPLSGHLGLEKTYTSVARNFWWPHMYKWVQKYVKTCETCQRVKPAPSASAPLMILPVPADCWRSVSMDFIFELPADARGHTDILVFVCRLKANAEDSRGLKGLRTSVKRNLLSFIETGEAVRQRVRDAMAAAQDCQKENSDRHGRANTQVFQVGDQVLLNAKNLPSVAVSAVGSTKLRPSFIGPFTVIGVHGHAYTLDLPPAMATHPTFYVGLLKPYHPAAAISPSGSAPPSIDEGHSPSLPAAPPSQEPGMGRIAQHGPLGGARRGPPKYRHASRTSGSSRDTRTRNGAPPRRSPRILTA
ncbi:unnamed protein product [Phytophthora fragariaefolia]|uniref:Unnamed protein product n=1 Tax=Phytophthora fragariaefolia TaxID=1490495 RepID=A0A9W6UF74_9STRA|nr:unnamed protein product [Phytophthora fragariaefolia]